jgi:hypothetical protein
MDGVSHRCSGIRLNPNGHFSCELRKLLRLDEANCLRNSEGNARMTLFAGSGNARTFDYSAGDVGTSLEARGSPFLKFFEGYVPPSLGHYVENIGSTPLKYLEIFNSRACISLPKQPTIN